MLMTMIADVFFLRRMATDGKPSYGQTHGLKVWTETRGQLDAL